MNFTELLANQCPRDKELEGFLLQIKVLGFGMYILSSNNKLRHLKYFFKLLQLEKSSFFAVSQE